MPAADSDQQLPQRRVVSAPLIWLVAVASILVGAFLLFAPAARHTGGGVQIETDGGPDLTIDDAIITRYRDTGALKYRLRSVLIEHFEPRRRTLLSEPDLTMYSEPEPPWQMTAARGIIRNASPGSNAAEEQVYLDQDVIMTQQFADGRSFVLSTPNITVYPDREYAETSQDVMITTHAGRTKAVGLKGNLDHGLLYLYSNDKQRVHTIVLPDQFK